MNFAITNQFRLFQLRFTFSLKLHFICNPSRSYVPVEGLADELAQKGDWDAATRRSARTWMTALEFARRETAREFGAFLLPAADLTLAADLRSVRDLGRSRQSRIVLCTRLTFERRMFM